MAMRKSAESRINEDDAREWLDTLQQGGEAWYRQCMLAVRAKAHDALGLTQREFAQRIGQKLIDPTPAIIELYNDQPASRKNLTQIADVLGISTARVGMVLAAEGLIEMTPARRKMIEEGRVSGGHDWQDRAPAHDSEDEDQDDGDDDRAPADDDVEYVEAEELEAENAALQEALEAAEANIAGAKKKHRDEVKELKKKLDEYAAAKNNALRDAMKKAQDDLTDQQRELAKKEAEAQAQEDRERIMASLAHLIVRRATGALDDAKQAVAELIEKGVVLPEYLSEIESAHAAFIEEMKVARMAEQKV